MESLLWISQRYSTAQSDYTVDGIHPNDSGYLQMRDLVNQAL
jgi:lysophospholipase L1-like esterase